MQKRQKIVLMGALILLLSMRGIYETSYALVDKEVQYNNDLPAKIRETMLAKDLILTLCPKSEIDTIGKAKNTYLRGYLINNTDTATIINRSDAVLRGITSEIFKDCEWQRFQYTPGSSCGNSYWRQTLESGKNLLLHYAHAERGNIRVPFRLRLEVCGTAIYSNVIIVEIDQRNYDRINRQV